MEILILILVVLLAIIQSVLSYALGKKHENHMSEILLSFQRERALMEGISEQNREKILWAIQEMDATKCKK